MRENDRLLLVILFQTSLFEGVYDVNETLTRHVTD